MPLEGIVCVLKPPGMTSSDLVVDIRRIFQQKRVGHTGTLDPAAAGVLPVCIGRATRLFDYLVDKQKEYVAELRFGAETDTEDALGRITDRAECDVSEDELKTVLRSFVGEQEQVPPIYSSLSVNGVKLYKLARRGEVTEPVDERRRRITVFELELIEKLERNRFLVRIVCSKGTYVRSLVRDIGRALGCPAYLAFLLRSASGSFTLGSARTIAELSELKKAGKLASLVVPMDEAVAFLPELRLNELSSRQKKLLVNGAPVQIAGCEAGKKYRLYIDDEFVGLASLGNEGLSIDVWLG